MPEGKRYNFDKNGVDISTYVDQIIQAEQNNDKVSRIKLYVELLKAIKDTDKVSYNGQNNENL